MKASEHRSQKRPSWRSDIMRNARSASLAVLGFIAIGLSGCNSPQQEPTAGSNSNWLHACEQASECTNVTACTCGACTRTCANDTDCAGLGSARCALDVSPATWATCQSNQPNLTGICLPACEAGGCQNGQACVNNFCSLLTIPSSSFCSNVGDWQQAGRTGEDQLLDLIQQSRVAAGVTCGTGAASLPVPALRLDARLTCAARVFASDLAASGGTTLIDSQGRNTRTRLTAAGYSDSLWAEGFTRASSVNKAFSLMLADTNVCPALVSSSYVDVGIGVSGNVYVVTLAAP